MDEDNERANDWKVEAESGEQKGEGDASEAAPEPEATGEVDAERWEVPGGGDDPQRHSDLTDVGTVGAAGTGFEGEEAETGSDLGEVGGSFDDPGRSSGGSVGGLGAVITVIGLLLALGIFAGPWLFRLAFGKTYGEPCHESADCRSGICLTYEIPGALLSGLGGNEGICSYGCRRDEQCPEDARCFEGEHCAPKPTLEAGESCTFPWECREGSCLFRRERSSPLSVDMPPGLAEYEETGTCVTEKTREENRKARERMRKLRNRIEKMRDDLKGR